MNNSKKIFEELFINPNESFSQHLSINENYRILFSGRFGIGKTTFLKYYFRDSKDYNVIHLFPINYSLLANEDVFSYVKYDILVSLFASNDYPLKPEYYSFLKSWSGFMLDNIEQVITTTMLLIPKMGKQLNMFAKDLKQLSLDFQEYKRTKNEVEKDEINAFLSQFHNNEGGIYESNIITLIIQEWLNDIGKQGKTNILIIDDLDRIDPSHIFRLLNVFSAHFDNRDQVESKNKFGFSKVIFVCDVDNIKSIYENQFGVRTDFNGYLDKFYSKEIYRFDNKENIFTILNTIIKSIRIGGHLSGGQYIEDHPNSNFIRKTILTILNPLIWNGCINLRSLFKFFSQSITILREPATIKGEQWFPIENGFLSAIYILSKFVGDFDILKQKLQNLPKLPVRNNDHPERFIGNLVMLIDSSNSSIVKKNLMGGPSQGIDYKTTTGKGNVYEGNYMIFPLRQHGISVFTGILRILTLNGAPISIGEIGREGIDIHDLMMEVINEIVI